MTAPLPTDRGHVYLSGVAVADAAPALVRDTEVPALVRRLDSVDEELLLAEMSLYELVRQLEPVLPFGFGQDTVPPREPEVGEAADPPSPLAGRLTDLASRAHSLVAQLKVIVAAVDL